MYVTLRSAKTLTSYSFSVFFLVNSGKRESDLPADRHAPDLSLSRKIQSAKYCNILRGSRELGLCAFIDDVRTSLKEKADGISAQFSFITKTFVVVSK